MKRVNKKKIIIVIFLIILVICEIVAFKESGANKIIEISTIIIDNDNKLENETIALEATNGGESGYYILLPSIVNNKIVSKYLVEEKAIVSETEKNIMQEEKILENSIITNEISESTNNMISETLSLENSVNTINVEQNFENKSEEVKLVHKKPGEKIYITKSEIESKTLSLSVVFDKKEKKDLLLYNRYIETKVENDENGLGTTQIKIKGYLPIGATISVQHVDREKAEESLSTYINNKVSLQIVYDIKILYNETEYEPTDFDENVEVSITGLENIDGTEKEYKVMHITEDAIKEIKNVESEKNKVVFSADSFSEYAILLADEGVQLYNVDGLDFETVGDVWNGQAATSLQFGTGTFQDPYLISSSLELAFFAQNVKNGNSYENQYVNLITDIDLADIEWPMIGDRNNSFKGFFDGQGHKILNVLINIDTNLNSYGYDAYGFFASVGGAQNNTTIIKNLVFDNIQVSLNLTQLNNNSGYSIGTVIGTMFKNSKLVNVIVNSGKIETQRNVNLNSNSIQMFVGGLVGTATNTANSTSDPGYNYRYAIENCMSDVNITLGIQTQRMSYAGQYNSGGIIGMIFSQPVWPVNCLYTGSIDTNGLIGPIFGALRKTNTSYTNSSDLPILWNGNDAGNLTAESYFMGYMAKGSAFSTSVISGTSTVRKGNNSRNIAYVQGVNKGIYISDLDAMLIDFNTYVTNNVSENYINWEKDEQTNAFYFTPKLTAWVESNILDNYTIQKIDEQNTGTYSYQWYIDGTLDNTITGNVATINADFNSEHFVRVLVGNGISYTIVNFVIPKLTIDVDFNINTTNNSVVASLIGTGLRYVNLSDYTYQWYSEDISGYEQEIIANATSLTLNNLISGMDYRLVATNSQNEIYSVEGSFVYGGRTVVYVDYNVGRDTNDGFSPETAVKTMTTAYTKLNSTSDLNHNVIVLIGAYTNTDYLFGNSPNSTLAGKFSKNVTITGCYKRTNYNASLLTSYNGNGMYLYGNTCFQYLTFWGNTSNTNNGQTLLYAMGLDLTMGEGLRMERYSTSNKNTYALANGNAPDFHVLGGFLNYNSTELSDNANGGIITIKSGTYSRIISGSRNTAANYTSHNICGSSTKPFNVKVIIDIKNSTTDFNSYPQDINFIVGGQTDGSIYSNSEITIKGGKIGRVLGGSIGYERDMYGYPTNTFWGTSKINVQGGTINELYGGSLGRLTSDVYFYGTIEINVSGGTINDNLYGAGGGGTTGYNINSSDPNKAGAVSFAGKTKVTINITGGNINGNVYGGGYGNSAYLTVAQMAADGGALYGDSFINVSGGVITGNVYGAGRGFFKDRTLDSIAQMIGTSTVNINSGANIAGAIYGAGEGIANYTEIAKLIGTSIVNINTDLSKNVFGGANIAEVYGETKVYVKVGNHTADIYGGGNVGEVIGTSKVFMEGGTSKDIYCGGNRAGATNTIFTISGGTAQNVYGGSNNLGDIGTSTVIGTSGSVKNLYGGNNVGGTCLVTNVTLNGVQILEAAYGGGNQIETTTTNIHLQETSNATVGIFGGGNAADVTTTNVYCEGANEENVFGGSNSPDEVDETNVTITAGKIQNLYGGNNLAGNTVVSYVNLEGGEVINLYGAGSRSTNTSSFINTMGGKATSIYGGGNLAGLTDSHIAINGGEIQSVFGGANAGGNVNATNVEVNSGTIVTVYGGNDLGGITQTSNVIINGGTITTVYGGGNQVETNNTYVTINSNIISSVYGGGNLAAVNHDTHLNLIGAEIGDNIYGGGNEGTVAGNTNVNVKNCILNANLYAGGNGVTAVVSGNTNLIMQGNNTVLNSVFGGGNQAATGTQANNNSTSCVNIVGGNIHKNVYGGANTSVVYGVTDMNIGYDTVNDTTLEKGDIVINGTVFGGGEANASGSEVYDYFFISVTNGITMDINANGHTNFAINGSIFGSGNASSTNGTSYINIKNYGTANSPKSNISFQRATCLTLDNSVVALNGAKDRVNIYSNTFFSLSRLQELKLKNNSTLYLNYGANVVEKFSSVVDINNIEVKGSVRIDEETGEVIKNVDNRIYLAEGKNLNIAINEYVTGYGEIYGMTFFGLFTNTRSPHTSTGLYNYNYENADEITNIGTFVSNSYIQGRNNKTSTVSHDITVDGFYTNYNEDGYIRNKYVQTTPEDDVYYIWLVGENVSVTSFDFILTASKYATMGTYEMPIKYFSTPNTKFILSGFSAGLSNGIELINPDEIPDIALNENDANSNFGLEMRSGNNGWMTKNRTTFSTENGGSYLGTTMYESDNSTFTPALNFCFFHSQNLTLEQTLGSVKVRFQVLTPIDDLNYDVSYIDIDITLLTALYQDDYYESAITPGKEYGLFTTTLTDITDSSNFSTYYSLYLPDFQESRYYQDFLTYKRALVSRDSNEMPYAYPENTTITMLDMVTNKYYYYVVSAQDVQNSKNVYYLSDFKAMGSNNKYYDEVTEAVNYCNSQQNLEYENFIFHIDFSEAEIASSIMSNTILMELRDPDDHVLMGVLGVQRSNLRYSVYKNNDAVIDLNATIDKNTIYLGHVLNLNVTTDFIQNVIYSKTIYDTYYFDKKMGIKISIYDNNGNRLNSDTLLGVKFILNGISYYPRIDGTVRINIAEKVSNVLSRIKIDMTNNARIATGAYKIRVESFGSPDGIYYGLTASDMVELPITIINSQYGLKVYTDNNSKFVNKITGNTLNGSRSLVLTYEYSSGLANPNIAVSLYRRNYDTAYAQNYTLVDLSDYVTDELVQTGRAKEYQVAAPPLSNGMKFYTLKENLKSGTYKIVLKLYDGENFIGESYEYVIIK